MNNKKFTIKFYDNNGTTYLKTLNRSEVKGVPSFTSQINGGYGQCNLDLNLPFDDYGEGSFIDFMNVVKIYIQDESNPLGRLVYSGFISSYQPYLESSRQGVKVTLLGFVSLLSFGYYKNGSNYVVNHSSVDPAVIFKAIADHFSSVYPAGLIGYDSGGQTIFTVGTNVSYEFNEDKWLDALQNAFGTVGAGWFWHLDYRGQLILKTKPSEATHRFTIGKDIESIQSNKNAEKVINDIRVTYNANTYTQNDAVSVARFGTRTKLISDDRILNLATAQQRATQEINDNKVEKIKASVVINSNYDLESIKVGDTCKIQNMSKNQTTFNDNMLIVSVAYNFDKVTIELEEQTKFSLELKQFIS